MESRASKIKNITALCASKPKNLLRKKTEKNKDSNKKVKNARWTMKKNAWKKEACSSRRKHRKPGRQKQMAESK